MAAQKEVKIIVNTSQNKTKQAKIIKQQNQCFVLENLDFAVTLMSIKI